MKKEAISKYNETDRPIDVLHWLHSSGYKCSKSRFYNDIKAGRLRRNKAGIFTEQLVSKYASLLKKTVTGLTEKEEREDLAAKKARAEITKLNLQAERERLRLDSEKGKLIEKALFYQELAGRMVVLDSSFRRIVIGKSLGIISTVDGDPAKKEDLSKLLIDVWEGMLNEYATTKKFQVLILPPEPSVDIQESIGTDEI